MRKRTDYIDRIYEALDNNDIALAKEQIQHFYDETVSNHSGMMLQTSIILNYIAHKEGEEGIGKCWQYVSDNLWKGFVTAMKSGQMTIEDAARMCFGGEANHFSEGELLEDEEKYTAYTYHCGVCSDFAAANMLDTQGGPVGTIKEEHDWCLNMTGLPYYCVHGPFFFHKAGFDEEYPAFEFEFGQKIDEKGNVVNNPCKKCFYKDPVKRWKELNEK